ncbi:MAG: hypothetical protein AAGU27_27860 [Dehalobacterium sp.]
MKKYLLLFALIAMGVSLTGCSGSQGDAVENSRSTGSIYLCHSLGSNCVSCRFLYDIYVCHPFINDLFC